MRNSICYLLVCTLVLAGCAGSVEDGANAQGASISSALEDPCDPIDPETQTGVLESAGLLLATLAAAVATLIAMTAAENNSDLKEMISAVLKELAKEEVDILALQLSIAIHVCMGDPRAAWDDIKRKYKDTIAKKDRIEQIRARCPDLDAKKQAVDILCKSANTKQLSDPQAWDCTTADGCPELQAKRTLGEECLSARLAVNYCYGDGAAGHWFINDKVSDAILKCSTLEAALNCGGRGGGCVSESFSCAGRCGVQYDECGTEHDCGPCPPVCGNGIVESGEACDGWAGCQFGYTCDACAYCSCVGTQDCFGKCGLQVDECGQAYQCPCGPEGGQPNGSWCEYDSECLSNYCEWGFCAEAPL